MVFVLILAATFSAQERKINWIRLMFTESKHPYGTYAFKEYLNGIYEHVNVSRRPFREMLEEANYSQSYISLSNNFSPTVLETNQILEYMENGGSFLICATSFDKEFLDTLGLEEIFLWENTEISEYEKEFIFSVSKFFVSDTLHLKPTNLTKESHKNIVLRKRDQFSYFSKTDSSEVSVLASDSKGRPLAVKINRGKGSVILSTSAFLFTNIYLLYDENELFARYLLSYLNTDKISYTQFYELGKGEASSPLRYVLNQPALKFAIYGALFGLMGFVFFQAKRRQRIIPIVEPPKNTTLVFVKTVGNLYFENKGHKSIAEKRYLFFLEQLRNRFYIDTNNLDDITVERLHKKSGVPDKLIKNIFDQINFIKSQSTITAEHLQKLSEDLDLFYKYI